MDMKYWIKIQNQGEIDVNGIHLIGASNKRGDDSKIGFFGSGNKYAIALLLREKIPFKIFSGNKKVSITTEPVMFRGELYEQIVVDGEKTSLTTTMGPDWETWFAVREIYCNALDEGEAKIGVEKDVKSKAGETHVYIELTESLSQFFQNINDYIITSKKPIYTSKTFYGSVDMFEGGDEFICYRKGIRIYPKNSTKSLYQYNFEKIEINESRVYKYPHQVSEQIASALTVCEDRKIIINFLKNWKNTFEANLHWESEGGYVHDKFSQTWNEVLEGKRVYPESVAVHSGDFEGKHNSFIVPDNLANKIAEEISGCEVVGRKQEKEYHIVEPTPEQQDKINKSLEQLERIGYKVTSEIKLATAKIDDVVAWYDKEFDVIYLVPKYLTTVGEIKNTILEEHFHSLGLVDGQRSFVTYLIDELIREKERTNL